MKAIRACVFIVTTILTSHYASAQTGWTLNGEPLTGPVHAVQIEYAEVTLVEGKEGESVRWPHQKVVYDRSGNEIERINFNRDGSIANRSVHMIDANGRIAGWKEYEPEASGKQERLTGWAEWIYDERGNRIEVRVYRQEVLSHQTTATYDTAGRMIEERMIADDGAWIETKKLTYDSAGHVTKTVIDRNGTAEVIEQSYDSSGKLTRYKYSSPDGRNDREAGYFYDAHGREVEQTADDPISKFKLITSYDSRGRVSKRVTYFDYKRPNISMSHAPEPGTVEFRYNANDKVVEESVYSPQGAVRRKTINNYDNAGKMLSRIYQSGDATSTKTDFKYDKWGNCIKTETPGSNQFGKPFVNVRHLVITYYDGK